MNTNMKRDLKRLRPVLFTVAFFFVFWLLASNGALDNAPTGVILLFGGVMTFGFYYFVYRGIKAIGTKVLRGVTATVVDEAEKRKARLP